jgi:hypothetical protein
MSRTLSQLLLAGSATLAFSACDAGSSPVAAPTASTLIGAAARTAQPAQATLMPGVRGEIQPLLTVGDTLPNGSVWAPIPDGLGGYLSGNDLILYSNHELSNSGVKDVNGVTQFAYSRVSRLVLDRKTLAVKDASYVVNGSEQYLRLCSATWVGAKEGFPSGYFFTGEESLGGVHDGVQLAVGTDGTVHELPWIGRFSHENLTAVPYRKKVVVFGTDDTSGASELYMYVGNSEADVINGTGKLYVFKGRSVTRSGDLKTGEGITGDWVEVPNSASLSSAALQSTVNSLGAFAFIRLEDSDYDHRPGAKPALYFVDTGAPVLCNGTPCDAFGSIYRLDINTVDPAGPARLVLLARSQGAQSGWSSPDNIAVGPRSLMLQEDPANSTFAGQRAPQVWQFGLTARGITSGRPVAELTNPTCDDVAGTCWESTGIIDASAWLGQGAWLFNVQAHTLPSAGANLPKESGQLLSLRIRGS